MILVTHTGECSEHVDGRNPDDLKPLSSPKLEAGWPDLGGGVEGVPLRAGRSIRVGLLQ